MIKDRLAGHIEECFYGFESGVYSIEKWNGRQVSVTAWINPDGLSDITYESTPGTITDSAITDFFDTSKTVDTHLTLQKDKVSRTKTVEVDQGFFGKDRPQDKTEGNFSELSVLELLKIAVDLKKAKRIIAKSQK